MTIEPRITVGIPTYRRPKMLERAVRSVLNQTLRDVRVAVFDNASGDETLDVLKRLRKEDSRVEYHVHSRNLGAGPNFDFAVSQVRTPYFSLLSDDDLLLPDFLAEGVNALEAHPDAGFFCGRIVIYNELAPGIHRAQQAWAAGVYEPSAAVACRMLGDHFATTGVVFRQRIRESIGVFSRFPVDRDYVAVAASKHSFVVSEREVAVFVVHAASFTAADPGQIAEPGRLVSVRFARDCLFSSLPPLLGNDDFSSDDKTAVFRAAMEVARRDTLYLLLIKALPAGRFGEIDEALAIAPWIGLDLWTRTFLRLVRMVGRVPLLRLWIASSLRLVATVTTKRLYEPFDAPQNRELVAFVRGLSQTGGIYKIGTDPAPNLS